jgi:hypothetical protein
MELQLLEDNKVLTEQLTAVYPSFIEGNSLPMALEEMRSQHIIPVFTRDNEPAISHQDFIQVMGETVDRELGLPMTPVDIRVSHPIKGRIPSARHKPAAALLPHEKTLYYERCAFLYRIPGITREIGGQLLTLTIGGIKAYNLDNLNRNGGSPQVFKIFIGFQVKVCSNLCIFTDGYKDQIKTGNLRKLSDHITQLLHHFDEEHQYRELASLMDSGITEKDFAQLVGRCRMYQHLAMKAKKALPVMMLSDSQINQVVKSYTEMGEESLHLPSLSFWELYNLFTRAVKSTYIDAFLARNANSLNFVNHLRGFGRSWFLDG